MKKLLTSLTGLGLFALLIIAFLWLALTPAHAQGYFTNSASGSFFGAQQYNQNYPAPTQPGQTIAAQYRTGINAGTGNSGIWSYATNSFATNYVYSATPAVTVQQYGAFTLTQTNAVIAITTSNYIVYFGGATNVNYSVLAIGH